MRELNYKKRVMFFELMDFITTKEDWSLVTRFKFFARAQDLEEIYNTVINNMDITENEFLKMVDEFPSDVEE